MRHLLRAAAGDVVTPAATAAGLTKWDRPIAALFAFRSSSLSALTSPGFHAKLRVYHSWMVKKHSADRRSAWHRVFCAGLSAAAANIATISRQAALTRRHFYRANRRTVIMAAAAAGRINRFQRTPAAFCAFSTPRFLFKHVGGWRTIIEPDADMAWPRNHLFLETTFHRMLHSRFVTYFRASFPHNALFLRTCTITIFFVRFAASFSFA